MTIRIDHNTVIVLPADTPQEVARQRAENFKKRLAKNEEAKWQKVLKSLRG